MENEWFASWFDTKYYHTLYKNRDDNEAKAFIKKLVENLKLSKGQKVLDLGCGKGRHSVTLNELGYDVLGADLSSNSIDFASKSSKENLKFIVHDMREIIPNVSFSAIFNLFTSFGYFDEESDNLKVLNAAHQMLNDKGVLVIDFMNTTQVINSLTPQATKIVDGIAFSLSKRFDGKYIYKDIKFKDEGKPFHFTERVQALTIDVFESLLSQTGFKILRTFGDFNLNSFNKMNSERLIIIAQKN